MTLEEINNKINGFNRRLDEFITDLQAENKFDEGKLKTLSGAIERVILNDPTVKKILLDTNAAQRQEYIDAIKKGMENTTKLLQSYKMGEVGARKDKISDIADKSNKGLKQTIDGIEKIDNNDNRYVYKDSERFHDLNEKIAKIDASLDVADKFDEVKIALAKAGRADTVDEAIKVCKEIENDFKNYEDKSENIEKINTIDFSGMFEKYKRMRGNVIYDLEDSETQKLLVEMRKAAKLIDYVDGLDSSDSANFVRAVENMPSDLRNQAQVDAWIATLQSKFNDTNLSKKLDTSKQENKDFRKSRKDYIKSQFISKLEASPVHKNLSDVNFDDMKKLSDQLIKNYIQQITKNVTTYKSIEGKTKADLIRYRDEAKKLAEAYDASMSAPGTATINGKTRIFSADMTDESQSKDALAEIKALPNDNEFKGEFEAKALALAGTRPANRWYHKVLSFITFRRYMTPEDKYVINLENKRKEIVSDIIKENKEKREEANKHVQYDKDAYKSIARKEIIDNKGIKKIDRKKIQSKREDKSPLTR